MLEELRVTHELASAKCNRVFPGVSDVMESNHLFIPSRLLSTGNKEPVQTLVGSFLLQRPWWLPSQTALSYYPPPSALVLFCSLASLAYLSCAGWTQPADLSIPSLWMHGLLCSKSPDSRLQKWLSEQRCWSDNPHSTRKEVAPARCPLPSKNVHMCRGVHTLVCANTHILNKCSFKKKGSHL